ncbi:MAG: hypothetical protein KGP14_05065 [Betaproteobacteria bacterium]|nr:hypothetical protein [Betaproteobacteria bacterium]
MEGAYQSLESSLILKATEERLPCQQEAMLLATGLWRILSRAPGEYDEQAEAPEYHATNANLQDGDNLEAGKPVRAGETGKARGEAQDETHNSHQATERKERGMHDGVTPSGKRLQYVPVSTITLGASGSADDRI